MKTPLLYLIFLIPIMHACTVENPLTEDLKPQLVLLKEYKFEDILRKTHLLTGKKMEGKVNFDKIQQNSLQEFPPYLHQFEIQFHPSNGDTLGSFCRLVSETHFKNYKIDAYNYWLPVNLKVLAYADSAKTTISSDLDFQFQIFGDGYIQLDQIVNVDLYQSIESAIQKSKEEKSNIPDEWFIEKGGGAKVETSFEHQFVGSIYEMTASEVLTSLNKDAHTSFLESVFGTQEKFTWTSKSTFQKTL